MGHIRSLRKRLLVDLQIQGALAVRFILYWLLCLFAVGLLLLLVRFAAKPAIPLTQHLNDLWFLFRPAALVSLILLPIVVLDLMRFTNSFAGPVFRLRQVMRDLAKGKPVEEIRFRKGDFWQEFGGDFNVVVARLRKAEAAASQVSNPSEEAELVGAAGASD